MSLMNNENDMVVIDKNDTITKGENSANNLNVTTDTISHAAYSTATQIAGKVTGTFEYLKEKVYRSSNDASDSNDISNNVNNINNINKNGNLSDSSIDGTSVSSSHSNINKNVNGTVSVSTNDSKSYLDGNSIYKNLKYDNDSDIEIETKKEKLKNLSQKSLSIHSVTYTDAIEPIANNNNVIIDNNEKDGFSEKMEDTYENIVEKVKDTLNYNDNENKGNLSERSLSHLSDNSYYSNGEIKKQGFKYKVKDSNETIKIENNNENAMTELKEKVKDKLLNNNDNNINYHSDSSNSSSNSLSSKSDTDSHSESSDCSNNNNNNNNKKDESGITMKDKAKEKVNELKNEIMDDDNSKSGCSLSSVSKSITKDSNSIEKNSEMKDKSDKKKKKGLKRKAKKTYKKAKKGIKNIFKSHKDSKDNKDESNKNSNHHSGSNIGGCMKPAVTPHAKNESENEFIINGKQKDAVVVTGIKKDYQSNGLPKAQPLYIKNEKYEV